jgi:Flp pilus assembly protein TadB
MFTNIMTGPTAIDVAGVSALGQALVYREDEKARRSDKWNRELAQRLEAELVTLDSLAHGFAAAESLRRPANRSPARIRLGRVVVALLAIGLALAAVIVLGLRGARAQPPDLCLHAEAIASSE